MSKFPIPFVALWLLCVASTFAGVKDYADKIAPLIDPEKLATLGDRAGNQRVRKYVHWLGMARIERTDPRTVAAEAVRVAGYKGEAATMTINAMMRNLDIATQLGCFDAEGMAEMKKGNSPTIKKGPYYGQELSTDHIIPYSVVPELDNVIANLELLPLKLNSDKRAKITQRQRDLAEKLFKAGLLSAKGLKAVRNHEP